MAALYKHASSELFALSRNVLGTICLSSLRRQGVRCLYSPASLGMENYLRSREKVGAQFQNISDKFRTKMKDYTEKSASNMIFTEDLKNMLHLTESSEDVDLVVKMMRRFNQQNKNIRFGNFVFGPVVMRMFYHLNKPEEAFNAFKDPELDGLFDQIASYQILLDLLFTNELYDKILEAFEVIKKKQLEGSKYPKNIIVLVYASLYKMNTTESFQKAKELWAELQSVGHIPMRRAVTFAAALAIKQNAPHDALEMLSGLRQQSYVSVRNLKVTALADIGRPEDTFPILRSLLEADVPQTKFTISKESIDKLRQAISKQPRQDVALEFEQIEKRLIAGEHILDTPESEWLCAEMQHYSRSFQNDEHRYLAASFNRQNRGSTTKRFGDVFRPRPGLAQMS